MAEIITFVTVFAFGASIGSFLNVCIYRIPEGKSIISPPSSCPNCSNPIRFYDNIPIISYLILFGRCRNCKASISIQYPIVEALTGFFAVLILYYFGFTIDGLIYFLFIASLIVITFIDLKLQIIPDIISLPGIIVGFICSSFLLPTGFINSLLGIFLGGGSLFLVAYGYKKVAGIEGMGGGDIKLIAMVGAFLGWKAVIMTIFAGSFVGAIIGTIAMLIQGKDTKYAIPFGPFLALGAALYLFIGQDFINWYVRVMWR
ncbi:MAG: prepilin peptidase [Deltaproteobacteria bacterium]|nr:prepilin peptidase [Deltaproteobacteria bacterium]